MFKHKLFSVFIVVFILLSLSQTVFAGGYVVNTTASCDGEDIVVAVTANSDVDLGISWTGTSSGSISQYIYNETYLHIITGPGTFDIIVYDYNYPTATFNITCATGTSDNITVDIKESSPLIELCDDGRTNKNLCEPIAIYPVESDDGVGMVIYHIPRDSDDVGIFKVYIAAEDLDRLPDEVAEACTIATSADGLVGVYLLPDGAIQVQIGPDEEYKYFVYRYESFPSLPEVETYFGDAALPILPSCWESTEVSLGISSMPF